MVADRDIQTNFNGSVLVTQRATVRESFLGNDVSIKNINPGSNHQRIFTRHVVTIQRKAQTIEAKDVALVVSKEKNVLGPVC